ncbi:acyltransferase [Sphingobacterium lumbrici]|uniref:acyltransferase n=1 Tax=Sphingobacterium lumbrici TaxID=2559600 RepID=UPI0011296541|nr:acyltransferase family protein [Sphingobacterium lumbrici]
MKTDKISKQYEWIDSIRVLATLSVIFLHVAAPAVYQYGSVSNFDWWIGNIYDSSVRFCVPVFLMISGTLILSKTYESTGEYLKKRVLRILFPFLFWSIIYIAKDLFLKVNRGEVLGFIEVLEFIFLALKNGASFHMWYVYLIIGLYLFFPIIGKWINKSNEHEIRYFLGIWTLTVFAQLPIVKNMVPNIDITYFSGYIGFPILGYYLGSYTFDFNRKKVVYVLSILTGILITIFGTFFITHYHQKFTDWFYAYLTPNVILVSIGVFLFFKDFVNLGKKTAYIILFFSKYSYGTYLIHILVLWVLQQIGFSYSFVNSIIGIPVTSVLCFLISTFIVFGLSKLPMGRYIAG